MKCSPALLALFAGTAAVTSAVAQPTVSSSVVGTGGGVMTGGTFAVAGTIGQPVIGHIDGAVDISQGFWYTLPRPQGSGVEERVADNRASGAVELLGNVPNPFSDWTEITLRLPKPGHVSVRLYDQLGRLVQTLIDGEREAGSIVLRVDSEGLVSGRYTAQLTADGQQKAITMILVR